MTINATYLYDQPTSISTKSAWVLLYDTVTDAYRKYEAARLPRNTDSAAWLQANTTAQAMWDAGVALTAIELRKLQLLRDADTAHAQIASMKAANTQRKTLAQADLTTANGLANSTQKTLIINTLNREIAACDKESERLVREDEIIYALEMMIRQSLT